MDTFKKLIKKARNFEAKTALRFYAYTQNNDQHCLQRINLSLKRPKPNPVFEKILELKNLRPRLRKLSQLPPRLQYLKCLKLKKKRKKTTANRIKSMAKNKKPKKTPSQLSKSIPPISMAMVKIEISQYKT